MIKGYFEANIPFAEILIQSERAVMPVTVVIDTGFTGDLVLDPLEASEFNLKPAAVTKLGTITGDKKDVPVAVATAVLEGAARKVSIFVTKGFPAVGIGFFTKFGYKIDMDCRNRTILLEKV